MKRKSNKLRRMDTDQLQRLRDLIFTMGPRPKSGMPLIDHLLDVTLTEVDNELLRREFPCDEEGA